MINFGQRRFRFWCALLLKYGTSLLADRSAGLRPVNEAQINISSHDSVCSGQWILSYYTVIMFIFYPVNLNKNCELSEDDFVLYTLHFNGITSRYKVNNTYETEECLRLIQLVVFIIE